MGKLEILNKKRVDRASPNPLFLLCFMVGTRGFECAKGAQAPGRGLLYPPLEGLAPLVHGGALHLSAS